MKKIVRFLTVISAYACTFFAALMLAACGGNYVDKLSVKGQTAYMTGDEFAGATLTVTYSNGSREQIDVTADMINGFDTSVAGSKTVVISYGGKTTALDITVTDMYAKEILVNADSDAEYLVGSNYADGDAVLTVLYTDGSTAVKNVTADMISGFDTSTDGKKTVRVFYGALTASYEITVRYPYVTEATVDESTRLVYRVGDEFEKVVLNVVYEDGSDGVVTVDDVNEVVGFDTSEVGNRTILVTHRNSTVNVNIEVKKAIKSVSVGSATALYGMGDEFDAAELEVVYADDSTERIPVTADMIIEFDTESVGSKTVKIDFEGRELGYNITVAARFVDNGGVNKIQAEDDSLVDMSGAQIQSGAAAKFENTATLSDGSVVPNGAEGLSTANISVKNNKIVIRFISDTAGRYKLGLRAQSGSGSGRSDQAIQDAFKLFVNGAETSISGTIGKASTGSNNWKDMTNWTVLDSICEIDVKAGLNEIEFAYQGEASTMRLPNIDYFTLTAV